MTNPPLANPSFIAIQTVSSDLFWGVRDGILTIDIMDTTLPLNLSTLLVWRAYRLSRVDDSDFGLDVFSFVAALAARHRILVLDSGLFGQTTIFRLSGVRIMRRIHVES